MKLKLEQMIDLTSSSNCQKLSKIYFGCCYGNFIVAMEMFKRY